MTSASSLLPLPGVSACSPPLVSAPMDADRAAWVAARFKALADPARLRLLSLIAAHESGEACVCDLTEPVGLSQPTVSHHLKVLREAGLVTGERRGTWVHYRLVPGALTDLATTLGDGLASSEPPPDAPAERRLSADVELLQTSAVPLGR